MNQIHLVQEGEKGTDFIIFDFSLKYTLTILLPNAISFSQSLFSRLKLPFASWSSHKRVNWVGVHVPEAFHTGRQLAQALEMESSFQGKI